MKIHKNLSKPIIPVKTSETNTVSYSSKRTLVILIMSGLLTFSSSRITPSRLTFATPQKQSEHK